MMDKLRRKYSLWGIFYFIFEVTLSSYDNPGEIGKFFFLGGGVRSFFHPPSLKHVKFFANFCAAESKMFVVDKSYFVMQKKKFVFDGIPKISGFENFETVKTGEISSFFEKNAVGSYRPVNSVAAFL